VYEDSDSAHDGPAPELRAPLTLETLIALPPDLLAELKKASETIDIEAVTRVVEQIQSHDPATAQALAKLVEQYRFDLIHELLKAL
jgi:indole-3-glycerol phosphate synthase